MTSFDVGVRIWLGLLIALIAALLITGCSGLALLHSIDQGDALTPEQVKAYRETGQDVYFCLNVSGPPPIGGTTVVLVPKDKRMDLGFSATCQLLRAQAQP